MEQLVDQNWEQRNHHTSRTGEKSWQALVRPFWSKTTGYHDKAINQFRAGAFDPTLIRSAPLTGHRRRLRKAFRDATGTDIGGGSAESESEEEEGKDSSSGNEDTANGLLAKVMRGFFVY